jgi:hypothetical protein
LLMNELAPSIESIRASGSPGRLASFRLIGPRLVGFDPLEFNRDAKEVLAFPAVSEREETVLDRP